MTTPASDQIFCPECGAKQAAAGPVCWLCDRPLGNVPPIRVAKLGKPPAPPVELSASEPIFAVLSWLVLLGVIFVGLMLVNSEPTTGIVYSILAGIALLIAFVRGGSGSSVRGGSGSSRGEERTWGGFFRDLILSIGMVFGTLVAIVVALVLALFMVCAIALSR